MQHVEKRSKVNVANQAIQETYKQLPESYWRPQFHISPPANWMNDPNGFSYYKGEYHLFYQHHPFGVEWGPMHWGHVKSKDLAVWEHLPIALAPSEDYDQDGCFSGSAIEKDGKLYLMYTGNTWTGDNPDEDLYQVQALAVSEDGLDFEKISNNPVISNTPEGDIHPFHFRDPKVWKHEDYYYCVLGSKTKNEKGQILLYRSKDLLDWEFLNIAAKGEGNFGFMWECPDIFRLNGYDFLVMSPQGVHPEGSLYHNLHQAGYVYGKLDYSTGKLDHGSFHLLDYGFDFYAPQTTIDEKGRRIMIAWMAMWESEMPEQDNHWSGAMTVPRELTFDGKQLLTKPVPELSNLRMTCVEFDHEILKERKEWKGVEGDCLELELEVDLKDANVFGIYFRANEEETEQTVLTYHSKEEELVLDRNSSGVGPGGIRKAPVKLKNNKLHLQIFIDRSSVEVFINHGEKVMTGRIYPGENSKGISFFADKELELVSLKKWDLKKGISV
ncbi:glycoside hydrolase family 32 protein [Gracilibacillus sp. YIM 98692]|uniref:glycoside hydrolase family 32 protein n=1 Tax=Gracilibacillus sp. YIM 98692 TaxID=2663532 RepID=UPI0013D7F796|nr:glycoside hydrolase family 32 protein [Gracilibacillus sp. YIM 98692]